MSFTRKKAQELRESGRYWGVRTVPAGREWINGQWVDFEYIRVKLARDQDGKTIWRKNEWEAEQEKEGH